MVEIISIILLIIVLVVLKIILGVNLSKMNELSGKNQLDEMMKKLPDTVQMGKEILKQLGNENVKIEKSTDEKTGTSLYLVMFNKIIIANGNGSYATVQTMAHECLHSVQSKRMLWFNYIFSNFYIIYTILVIIFTILGIIKNTTLQLYIISVLGFIFFAIRSYLETDAMTKAKYVAKEYLENKNVFRKDELQKLIDKYEELNNVGIPTTNFILVCNVISKLLLYCIIALIF